MKKVFLLLIIFKSLLSYSQNDSTLIIDNVNARVSLPFWLKAGQSIDLVTNTKLVSIIEFTISNNNLIFSQAISLTAAQTVPANKVWKIEGIGVTTQNSFIPSSNGLTSSGSSSSSTSNLPTIYQSPKKFETVGIYNWKVPPGVTSICIEVWGGGAGGSPSGSGGGGGYGYQCYTVVPLTNYIVTVGAGGYGVSGGSSSVGNLISASGGTNNGGIGGSATSSTGTIISINGDNGGGYLSYGGNGGNGGNGGASAYQYQSFVQGYDGAIPGGGGGYGSGLTNGARGQVYIYW